MFCPAKCLPPWPVTAFDTMQWLPAGNMAGESAAVRSRLQANGAVKPLLQLLLAADGHREARTLSAACTAAWALSNLLQDQSHAVSCSPLSLSPYSSCFACFLLATLHMFMVSMQESQSLWLCASRHSPVLVPVFTAFAYSAGHPQVHNHIQPSHSDC